MRENNLISIVGVVLILMGFINIVNIHIRYDNGPATDYFLDELEMEPTNEKNLLPLTVDKIKDTLNIKPIEKAVTAKFLTEKVKAKSLPEIKTKSLPETETKSILEKVATKPPTNKLTIPSSPHELLKMFNTTEKVELLPKTTVAYAVSFIMCQDVRGTANSANLVDASLMLRHSIHKISSRNPESGSKYDYKMYAFVHPQAISCSHTLDDLGFEVILVDHPVRRHEMASKDQAENIRNEFCCGEKEFIKLSAWNLPAELIVHLDIDFMFFKPMDHFFDAILYDKDSVEGKAARAKVMMELDTNFDNVTLPDKIGAFITRDWHQVAPQKWPSGCKS